MFKIQIVINTMDAKSKINNNDNIVIPPDVAKIIAEYQEKLEKEKELLKEYNDKQFGFVLLNRAKNDEFFKQQNYNDTSNEQGKNIYGWPPNK